MSGKFSAVLVTRGGVDLTPILNSLPAAVDDVVIWDNSKRPEDLKVLGRYAAVTEARHHAIYTQDDDCVVDVAAVLATYEQAPPGLVVANMPLAKRAEYAVLCGQTYPGIALVGWGACFDAERIRVLDRYIAGYGRD